MQQCDPQYHTAVGKAGVTFLLPESGGECGALWRPTYGL